MDAVASGLGADVIHRVADARRDALDDVGCLRDAETEDVDEWIARVRRLERDLSADRRNADAVTVPRDPGDDTFEQTRRPGGIERPKAQRVEERNRPRTHRENVTDDAADAGRCALIRLDERRMVVRFDLEDRRQSLADIHRTGVLARALQHLRAARRQRLQMDARALVAAVFGPHDREDAELGQVRLAAQKLDDAVVLVGFETVTLENVGIDHRATPPPPGRIVWSHQVRPFSTRPRPIRR